MNQTCEMLTIPTPITVVTVNPALALEADETVTMTQTIPTTGEAVEKVFGGWVAAIMAEHRTANMRRTQSGQDVEFAFFGEEGFLASILFLNVPFHVAI